MVCKGECSKANFGLNHPIPAYFVNSQWRIPQTVYFIWRLFSVLFFIICIILCGVLFYRSRDYKTRIKWFIYLTNWTFLTQTINVIIEAITVGMAIRKSKNGEEYETMPWLYKLSWMFYNGSTTIGIVVSLAWWILIFPYRSEIYWINYITHGANAIYILINFCITSIPLRILHVWQPIGCAVVYMVFSVIYDVSGGTNARDETYIYSYLDWNGDTKGAVLYAILVGFVAQGIAWVLLYGMYRLRLVIYKALKCENFCENKQLGSVHVMLNEKSGDSFNSL